jgi:hypothetical protein
MQKKPTFFDSVAQALMSEDRGQMVVKLLFLAVIICLGAAVVLGAAAIRSRMGMPL